MAGRPPADVLEIHWLIPLMIMHGREDELLAINETKNAVVQLENQGVDIEIRILEGVTHYDTSFYVAALRNAIPWLLEKWKDDSCELGRNPVLEK